MPLPPTGTVTFLFTDIEGSTRLWEQYPGLMRHALVRHDDLLRRSIETHGGSVFKTVGDGVCAVFPAPHQALQASLASQLALAAEAWPAPLHLRVRMALHTGAAENRDGDYFGLTVNRVARLLAVGHGGQMLLSAAAQGLAQLSLPDGAGLRDQGTHRLKDLQQPEHVYQLVHPSLPSDFPPLRSLQAFANNLPLQMTNFVGRQQEIRDILGQLSTRRLVTLTGAGGCGKTRLALQVGAESLERWSDGVWQTELASLTDPALVAGALAAAVGVREEPGRSLSDTLIDYLRPKNALLVLDNCEHLLGGCAALAQTLLQICPGVTVLATSREALNVPGEQPWRVPPLPSADPERLPESEKDLAAALLDYDAIRLFVDRARVQRPDFVLSRGNAAAVARVCRRLDGIPLAIELAAARVRALSVEEIDERLSDRFRLLTSGSRTALPRQQTLRALIDWSYDLLTAGEKTLLSRLSVFAGGWTLPAAEAVCAGDEIEAADVLDLLTGLVDKSLAVYEEPEQGGGRYRYLETVRQYAWQLLLASGQAGGVRDKHRDSFLALAERTAPKLTGPDQSVWLERLEADFDNFRQALSFCLEHCGEEEAGLRLGTALFRVWVTRGHLNEGYEYLTAFLAALPAQDRTTARSAALKAAGGLAFYQGDYDAARLLYEECLLLSQALGDQETMAASVLNLGNVALNQSDYTTARSRYEECLAISRGLGDQERISDCLGNLGLVAMSQGDYAAANSLYAQSLALDQKRGNMQGIATCLSNMGNVAYMQGDSPTARSRWTESLTIHQELGNIPGLISSMSNLGVVANEAGDHATAHRLNSESLALSRKIGDKEGMANSLGNLGNAAIEQGDYRTAKACLSECLTLCHGGGNKETSVTVLDALANLAQREQDNQRSARLLSTAQTIRETLGIPLASHERNAHEQRAITAREALGEEAFATAWAAGQAMTWEQAVEYALSDLG